MKGGTKKTFEHMFAVASKKGAVHILNGRIGTVRRITAEDQLRDDWEPFMEVPTLKKPKKKKRFQFPIESEGVEVPGEPAGT